MALQFKGGKAVSDSSLALRDYDEAIRALKTAASSLGTARIYLDKQSLGASSAKTARAKGMVEELMADLVADRSTRFNR